MPSAAASEAAIRRRLYRESANRDQLFEIVERRREALHNYLEWAKANDNEQYLGFGAAAESRRVAVYLDGRGRKAQMFLARSARRFCLISTWDQGVAASCSPYVGSFFEKHVAVMMRRVVFGATDDRVARVVVVGSRGRRHGVPLSKDGGFIYDCKAYAGCASVVDHVEAYAADGSEVGAAYR